MDQSANTWRLTVALIEAIDLDAEPRVAALAHLGVALVLLGECDPVTAERLAGVIEGRGSTAAE